MVLLFLWHIVGVSYSENTDAAWLDVSMKLSFFIFPIFAAFLSRNVVKRLLDYFLFIGALSALICISTVLVQVFIYDYNPLKSESEFSLFMHRSYQATYWVIGFLWSVFRVLEIGKNRWLYLMLAGILALGCFLTFSKAGILILLLSSLAIFLLLIFRYKLYRVALISLLSGVLALFLVNSITAKPLARFQAMTTQLFNTSGPESNPQDSNNARIIMWRTSWEIIEKTPVLGVGTGDVMDELNQANLTNGYVVFAEDNMNSHNQFLNTGVALGLVGMLILVVLFATSIYATIIQCRSKWFVLLTISTMIIFLTTESGFERQAGVVLFSLLICLFSIQPIVLDHSKESREIGE